MLTESAYRERKWGPFPALRQVLEDKRLPDHYFGPTSVSDNFLSLKDRIIEIALLSHEYSDKLFKEENTDFRQALCQDLEKLWSGLNHIRSFIDDQMYNIETLNRKIIDSLNRSHEI